MLTLMSSGCQKFLVFPANTSTRADKTSTCMWIAQRSCLSKILLYAETRRMEQLRDTSSDALLAAENPREGTQSCKPGSWRQWKEGLRGCRWAQVATWPSLKRQSQTKVIRVQLKGQKYDLLSSYSWITVRTSGWIQLWGIISILSWRWRIHHLHAQILKEAFFSTAPQ